METRKPQTVSQSQGPERGRARSRVLVITVLDTVAWLVVTAASAAAIGNSALLQIASVVMFTVLWFVAVRLWSPRRETMATAATSTQVARLRADGQMKAEEAARFFETLTTEQALTKTEIGWTVAATAAHLATSVGFTKQQITQLKQGKATRVPGSVIDIVNFLTTRANRKKPLAMSAAKVRAGMEHCLALLSDWSDTELEKRFEVSYYGASTYEEALHYALIGHVDEHLGQVKRALNIAE